MRVILSSAVALHYFWLERVGVYVKTSSRTRDIPSLVLFVIIAAYRASSMNAGTYRWPPSVCSNHIHVNYIKTHVGSICTGGWGCSRVTRQIGMRTMRSFSIPAFECRWGMPCAPDPRPLQRLKVLQHDTVVHEVGIGSRV